jgi:hypothetical protein
MIALYVDDILAACNDATWLSSFYARLGAIFEIKDLGDLSQLLGMHITRDTSARTISLDQFSYLRDIPAKHGMSDCKSSSMPMDPGFLSGLAHTDSPPQECRRASTPASLVTSNMLVYARVRMSLIRLQTFSVPPKRIPRKLISMP